jgi:hypothetical protein
MACPVAGTAIALVPLKRTDNILETRHTRAGIQRQKDKPMRHLPIYRRSLNLEVMAKLLNSAAVKYDCNVQYDKTRNTIAFRGDESLRRLIVEETAAYFGGE